MITATWSAPYASITDGILMPSYSMVSLSDGNNCSMLSNKCSKQGLILTLRLFNSGESSKFTSVSAQKALHDQKLGVGLLFG